MRLVFAVVAGIFFVAAAAPPVDRVVVTGTVSVTAKSGRVVDSSNVVVWLKPNVEVTLPHVRTKIVQHDKRFEPRLLVIPVGAVVDFPNLDPFFHNVFSLFDGKRFDLGLYEAGASRAVTFGKPGVSYIFCNIHPEMSAIVVAVDTPYYAVTNRGGEFTIPGVVSGTYTLMVWHERHTLNHPEDVPRQETIGEGHTSLESIRLVESDQVFLPHKNKYGRDYAPPPAASPIYK